jgi:acyl-CoA synthetase (AMP-forming)/AMP-acid ligase II
MTITTPPLRGTFATVDEVLDAAAVQHGAREAYVDGHQRLTFSAWRRAADGLAATMVDCGVRPGDVVALYLRSSIDYAISYAAIALAGGVATGISTRLGPREVGSILARTQPALVVQDGTLGDPGALGPAPVLERRDLEPAYTGPGLGTDRPARDATDAVTVIWTSGTTGEPKGAWFDHRNLAAAVLTAGVMSAPYDRRLSSTPFPHAGYMAKLWDQLAWGSTLVISPTPWSAASMRDLMVGERITVAGGVPTQWAKLLELPDLAGADFSHLRLCLAATAPASPELIEHVTGRLSCPMIVRYAMTESPSITGTDPADSPQVLYRTVGRPQAGVALSLVDEDNGEVDRGDVGRIRVKGPCVMRGYWNDPEQTAGALGTDGWLTSSDLGFIDSDDNLVLVGRATDLYIRGGYNVYPLEVENALSEHPGVGQAAVIGVPAPVIGEIGVAFVVPADGEKTPALEELQAWIRERLADYKAPDRMVLVDELPLTGMMKVDKRALRHRIEVKS